MRERRSRLLSSTVTSGPHHGRHLSLDRTLIVVDGPGCGASDPLLRRTPFNMPGGTRPPPSSIRSLTARSTGWETSRLGGGHVGSGTVAAAHPAKVKSLVAISAPLLLRPPTSRRKCGRSCPSSGSSARSRRSAARSAGRCSPSGAQSTRAIADNVDDAAKRFSRGSLANVLQSFMLDDADNSSTLPRVHCPPCWWERRRDEWTPAKMAASRRTMPDVLKPPWCSPGREPSRPSSSPRPSPDCPRLLVFALGNGRAVADARRAARSGPCCRTGRGTRSRAVPSPDPSAPGAPRLRMRARARTSRRRRRC